MKRLLAVLFLSSIAFAQGVFVAPQTAFRTTNGITYPLANATITVCAANASGIPCAPVTVSIFSDAAETHPLSNPFQADSNGNYIFAVSPGTYTVTVTGTGFTGNSYQVSVPIGAGVPVPTPGGNVALPGLALPVRFSYGFARADASPVSALGHGVACGSTAQNNSFTGSATETSGRTLTSSASASTNTVIDCGSAGGANPGQGFVTIGTSIRFSQRLLTQVTTNFRYWIGVMDASGVEYTGGNSTWPSDAPNRNYCNFRFSSGTDTNWKAICATSNVAQTIVDTGIAPSTTASMVFEITFTPVLAPTTANFFINGTQVATISTNLPATNAALSYGFMSDNKNTATAGSVVYFWNQYFEK